MGNSATSVLAANLRRLMDVHSVLTTQIKVAEASGVDQKTVSNCLNPDQRKPSAKGRIPSPTLHQVEKLAGAFKLDAWELLNPHLPVDAPRKQQVTAQV